MLLGRTDGQKPASLLAGARSPGGMHQKEGKAENSDTRPFWQELQSRGTRTLRAQRGLTPPGKRKEEMLFEKAGALQAGRKFQRKLS